MDKQDRLSVSLLGSFTLRHQAEGKEYTLTAQDGVSTQVWTFLQYLAIFHSRPVSQSELIEVLWGDDETSSNPANALKTLLHRARAAMEQLGFADGKEVILYKRGSYTWAPHLELVLDTERFDALQEQAVEINTEQALEAIRLYGGDFLPHAAGSPWAVSLRTYYRDKYIKLCNDTAATLFAQGKYAETVQICRKATAIDPYDEPSHLLTMCSLNASGAQQAAIQHYARVAELFMNQLGVPPSEELIQLYQELTRAELTIEEDLHAIRQELEEQGVVRGAYFCEFLTFQAIYQLEARSVQRSDVPVQLAMLTAAPLELQQRIAALDGLHQVIRRCLRSGDAFTRYSATQYLILLPAASRENGAKVLQRIIHAYAQTAEGKTVAVKYSLLPVLPSSDANFSAAPLPPGAASIR